jgi:tetratricopeptide (TPR) repeat protein
MPRLHLTPFVLLPSLSLLWLLWACGSGSQQDADKQAQPAMPDTLQVLDSLIATHPKADTLYYQRAKLRYTRQDTAGAFADVRRALVLAPDSGRYAFFQGFLHKVRREDDSARRYFQQSVDLQFQSAEPFYEIGNLHFLRERYDSALAWYKLAIKIDTREPMYPTAIGLLYYATGRYDLAERWANSALDLDPHYIKALHLLYDLAMYQAQDLDRAMAFASQMLEADSLHPLGRFCMGYYNHVRYQQYANSDPKRAASFLQAGLYNYTAAIQFDPAFARAHYHRGYLYFLNQQYDPAIQDFEAVIRLTPMDHRPYFVMGAIYEHYQDYARARHMYQRALKLRPSWTEAENALAAIKGK